MPDTMYPTGELSVLFIQKGFGTKPQFRGMHAITGDMSKSDGTYTPVYAWLAGEPIKIANQRGNPEPVTMSVDGPLPAIADLVGKRQDCPIDLVLVIDNCLSPQQKRSWGRWGNTDPQTFILMPDARIETRTISNPLSREGGAAMITGGFQIKFDEWMILKGNQSVSLTSVVTATTTAGIAFTNCSGCIDSNCGGVEGCSTVFMAAADGKVWKSTDGGTTWVDKSPAAPWTVGDSMYADDLVALAGGHVGVAGDYGVTRSTDGGATWVKYKFATAAGGKTGIVSQIIRFQDDMLAFTSLGIWRSVDDGLTWVQVSAVEGFTRGIVDDNGFGVAVSPAALYFTTDGGVRWAEVSTDAGAAMKGVALSGGYVHLVDSSTGYFRCPINLVRNNAAVWENMDATAAITDIMFCGRTMGYRLRGTAIDRTLNGGYSWETLSVGGTAPTFVQMAICSGRLAIAGGVYFAFYSPFYDDTNYLGAGSDCGC